MFVDVISFSQRLTRPRPKTIWFQDANQFSQDVKMVVPLEKPPPTFENGGHIVLEQRLNDLLRELQFTIDQFSRQRVANKLKMM